MNGNIKCGLEIHQRLDTNKLFCNCYADPNKNLAEKEFKINRRLRAAVGELGKVDEAALFEASGGKQYDYTCGEKTSCLIELDEEPPRLVNKEALAISLQVAKALKAKIVNEIHVMRKTIIDGSTVSGFQRTALIALNGKLTVGEKQIGIQTVSLEEESARIVERQGNRSAEYGLDRQGIPLVEIATAPDIDSPQLAKKVALELGEILRNTGKVQRGLGTIRQDVNISIEGGERVEVKGCQDLATLETLIVNEAGRHKKLLEIKNILLQRKAKISDKIIDITPVFQNTQSKIISNGIAGGSKALAVKLDGFGGLLSMQIMPDFSLGRELEDRAKTAGVKGTLHSDEDLTKFGISETEKSNITQLLGLSSEDAFMLCVDSESICKKALLLVLDRCEKALQGVPSETRKADGVLTRFMRPLAGSARMYPETDAIPINITATELAALKEIETPAKKVERYIKSGLNEELAKRMASHYKFQLFEDVISRTKCDAQTTAVTLLETLTALKREGVKVEDLTDDKLIDILNEYGEKVIAKAAIPSLVKLVCSTTDKSVGKLISENKLHKIEGETLRKIILENNGDIAEIMKKFKTNIDPAQLHQLMAELKAAGKLQAKPT